MQNAAFNNVTLSRVGFLKPISKMTFVEAKLFLRETSTVFFTFAFPLILLFVFGGIFSISSDDNIDGRQAIGVMVTGYMGLLIATTGITTMPTTIAAYREQGILRRLGVTPISPAIVVGAQLGVQLVMTAIGAVILMVAGRLAYGMEIPSAPLVVIPGLVLGAASLFAVGYVIAALIPTLRAAQVVGQALFFPMIFLSGATFPRADMPETVQRIADFLPLTHVVTLVQDLWFEQSWNLVSLSVLVGILVVGTIVGTRTFRWE